MSARRKTLRRGAIVALFSVASCLTEAAAPARADGAGESANRPNVLFITVDDLRPQLGCYGDSQVKSPEIDRLAARSRVFTRAYCQIALCNPSRMSFLSGLRPDTLGIHNIGPRLREQAPEVVTLPQLFKQHGYTTVSLGKVFHQVGGTSLDLHDDPASWSVPHWNPEGSSYAGDQVAVVARKRQQMLAAGRNPDDWRQMPKGAPWEAPEVEDSALPDGRTADEAIARLRTLRHEPFFLAVGFVKPHLPFVAPKKYWDLYEREKLRLPENTFAPRGALEIALTSADLRTYDIALGPGGVPRNEADKLTLLHGYLACISFVDAQIGRLLAELERLDLHRRTVVVVLGDHGFQVGEHNFWANKHTNFETSTRSPLLIAAPGLTEPGGPTSGLAELLDVFPTLAELAALPLPATLEGRSLLAQLRDPAAPGARAAFSQYQNGDVMGRSVRTDRWRYTEWADKKGTNVARELYDHLRDPGENVNVVSVPEHAAIVGELGKLVVPKAKHR